MRGLIIQVPCPPASGGPTNGRHHQQTGVGVGGWRREGPACLPHLLPTETWRPCPSAAEAPRWGPSSSGRALPGLENMAPPLAQCHALLELGGHDGARGGGDGSLLVLSHSLFSREPSGASEALTQTRPGPCDRKYVTRAWQPAMERLLSPVSSATNLCSFLLPRADPLPLSVKERERRELLETVDWF